MHARVVGPFMGQVLFSCLAVVAVAWLGASASHACDGPDCDLLAVEAAIVPGLQGVVYTESTAVPHEASLAPTIGIVERLGCSGSGAAQGLVLGALVILGLITRKEGEHP
jgi:hypothetical protein